MKDGIRHFVLWENKPLRELDIFQENLWTDSCVFPYIEKQENHQCSQLPSTEMCAWLQQ